eukprot:TRINITY_DN11462_c0_g1_i1.p1 TRINITY_DN11462_c0_g1~~TRINITY_DN11462_c0_g1_i1.p1  ORF type:complete len:376 (+),score=94.89 TRINITY_DN11462_c0_g1_i1:47-1129(+)
MVDKVPLPFKVAAGFRIRSNARFHPLKYTRGLAAYLAHSCPNVHIIERTRANRPAGTTVHVKVSTGEEHAIMARKVIIATHSPYGGLVQLETRAFPYNSYCAAVRVENPPAEDALFWDRFEPYNYTRLASGTDKSLLIVGGADHKSAQGDQRVSAAEVERYVRKRYKVQKIECQWSNMWYDTADKLPFIGEMPGMKDVFVATGFLGQGLIYSAVASQLLARLVLNQASVYADVFSPSRLELKLKKSAFMLLKENANVAKKFVSGTLTGKKVENLDDLKRGEGCVVRRHRLVGKPTAAYRDNDGQLHLASAVCTHAGCVVEWNDLEKTFDCPCHGGRYTATGEVMFGPPPRSLAKKSVEDW